MEELLALMEESVPEETQVTSTSRIPERNESQVNERSVSFQSTVSAITHRDLNRSRPAVPQGLAQASIDDRLGIRMIKRRISSVELTDLVASHPYHSPATISAMSRAALNRLLQEPAAVISEATVCGRTILMTVGIVFTNSGTRISSNGRAFSILQIGNLNTGPVVSVFLFGEAYSQHCSKCPPGTVVALVMPNLMSPKEGSRDCAVALSVADPRQLVPAAHARDYGVCKGTVSTKRADGQWISNGGQCKHHVDIRISQYCLKHRKEQNVKNGPVNKAKNLSFMQQQRMEHGSSTLARAPTPKCVMTMKTPAGVVVTHNPNGASLESQLEAYAKTTAPLKAPLHMTKQSNAAQPLLDGRSLRFRSGNMQTPAGTPVTHNASSASLESQLEEYEKITAPLKAPLHMTKLSNAVQHRPVGHLQTYCRDRSKSTGSRQPIRAPDTRVGSQPGHGDWLNPKRNSGTTTKKRAINRDFGGFDGSVEVPKPNKLFRAKALLTSQPLNHAAAKQQAVDKAKMDSVIENQRLVAERQKENPQLLQGRLSKLNKARVMKQTSDASLKESLFGKVDSMDMSKVMSQKSRFADEAEAEEYAKSRRIVTDLERREELKKLIEEKKKKASGASLKESSIQKEWVCATCKRTTKIRPAICLRASHNVSLKRDVKTSATVTEKRLKLDEQSVEDGGLKLGAGLEWDRQWHRF